MLVKLGCFLLLLCIAVDEVCFADAPEKRNVVVATYHDLPPFVTGVRTGLSFELAEALSSANDKYQFEVRLLPRKRLDRSLKTHEMIVPWVTPEWFGEDAQSKYQWSEALFGDGSIYIWAKKNPQDYYSPEDLEGRRLGGIRGYKYVGVDELVKYGLVERTDVSNERQLLRLLSAGRVDVGIGPRSGLLFLMKQEGWLSSYDFSSHHTFQRRLLIQTHDAELSSFVVSFAKELSNRPSWRHTLQQYGIQHAPSEDN